MLIKRASKLNDKNIEVFAFGKYLDKSVKWVLQTNPDYINWIRKNTPYLFSKEFEQELKRIKIT